MARGRVLMIGLDGFEASIAQRMMDEGRLPALQRLHLTGAFVRLDHKEKRTGLAWEHVSTALPPEATERWSVVDFDRRSYRVIQRQAAHRPFAAALDARTVVFDAPYFLLPAAPRAQGLTAWGAHDAGVVPAARPAGLAEEIAARFGPYPATRWIYGFTWPSAKRTQEMAGDLVRATDLRGRIAEWLLAERLPDWELALVTIGEYHSAAEAWWHGVDSAHPLHAHASAAAARDGIEAVYMAGDRMIARLLERFPDAQFVLFNLHGMGPNDADAASMLLLPELLYRDSFGKARLRDGRWAATEAGVPLLGAARDWEAEVARLVRPRLALPPGAKLRIERAWRRLCRRPPSADLTLEWMPTTLYRRYWPRMRAFALPGFLDGRIRINVRGRERRGMIDPRHYRAECRRIAKLLGECRDVLTGEPVAADIDFAGSAGRERGRFAADMIVRWNGAPLGFDHPLLGRIGPIPYRRTGGHTGRHGVAWFLGPQIEAGDHGSRDAFDVVPTAVEMLGEPVPRWMSGRSMLGEIGVKRVERREPEPVV